MLESSLLLTAGRFLGLGGNTGPEVVPYAFDDVVANLNAIAPYHWASFLRDRLNSKFPHAPLEGITQGGYKLVFTDAPGPTVARWRPSPAKPRHGGRFGIDVSADGQIRDVLVSTVSGKAGLSRGMQSVTVNGRQ